MKLFSIEFNMEIVWNELWCDYDVHNQVSLVQYICRIVLNCSYLSIIIILTLKRPTVLLDYA